MRVIRFHKTGDAGVLELADAPRPEPGPGQVLFKVEAIGLNFIEVYQRTGLYKVALPATPGSEAAGTVEQTGEGVVGVRVGDRIASVDVLGAYAEYAVVRADRAVQLPANVSTRQAAAVLLQGLTAHYLTTATCVLTAGDRLLIHAAAGGTGLLVCQIARHLGARAIGTVSTEAKAALAREAGARDVVLYTTEDFVAATRRLTGGEGVRVVYDSVGRTTFLKGFDCLARRGMMVLFGQSSGAVDSLDPLLLSQKGSLVLARPKLGDYIAAPEELHARVAAVLGWVAEGTLTVRIGAEFPLAEAGEAHRALEGRTTTGKVLLIP